MEVRRRNVQRKEDERQKTLEILQNLDVFNKLPEECEKSTSGGGLVTIITIFTIFILLIFEMKNYLQPRYVYSYEVDPDFSSDIQINIDITVATRCQYTSLDILDATGSDMPSKGKIDYRDTVFELTEEQQYRFERRRDIVRELRSQHHTLHDLLWKQDNLLLASKGLLMETNGLPSTVQRGNQDQFNACHMVGTLFVRKVAGNMHIVPGKPLTGLGGAHIHVAPLLSVKEVNFSHRIDHLSFGVPIPNRVDPLEAVEQISFSNFDAFHYKVDIVPTRVKYMFSTSDTYQYAVTMKDENYGNRSVTPDKSRNEIPGIFFTYDTFPLRVKVTETRELLGTFLSRLAALAGGLFATVGLVRQALCGVPEMVFNTRTGRRFKTSLKRYQHNLREKLSPDGGHSSLLAEAPLNPDSDT